MLLCCYILVKMCILIIKFSTLYVGYLQSLSCEFFLVVYPESRSGKPLTFSIHIFLLIYRKSSNMRIMNTPTADRNPIASGDTKRNGKKHIFKFTILSEIITKKYLERCKHICKMQLNLHHLNTAIPQL